MSLGLLTDLVTMGKDIKSLVKGDGSGFISKADHRKPIKNVPTNILPIFNICLLYHIWNRIIVSVCLLIL